MTRYPISPIAMLVIASFAASVLAQAPGVNPSIETIRD